MTDHTHEHTHEVVNPSGRPVHEDVSHSHPHADEINTHHLWDEEPERLAELAREEEKKVAAEEKAIDAVKKIRATEKRASVSASLQTEEMSGTPASLPNAVDAGIEEFIGLIEGDKMTTATRTWTKEEIEILLVKSDLMVGRSLAKLYERQTSDEKASESTVHLNGVGFNSVDSKLLSSLARWYLSHGNTLTRKQMTLARKMIIKYAGQLAGVANGIK